MRLYNIHVFSLQIDENNLIFMNESVHITTRLCREICLSDRYLYRLMTIN